MPEFDNNILDVLQQQNKAADPVLPASQEPSNTIHNAIHPPGGSSNRVEPALPAEPQVPQAHSTSEFKRMTALGANPIPPAEPRPSEPQREKMLFVHGARFGWQEAHLNRILLDTLEEAEKHYEKTWGSESKCLYCGKPNCQTKHFTDGVAAAPPLRSEPLSAIVKKLSEEILSELYGDCEYSNDRWSCEKCSPSLQKVSELITAALASRTSSSEGRINPEYLARQIFFYVLLHGGEGNPFHSIKNEWFVELASKRIAEVLPNAGWQPIDVAHHIYNYLKDCQYSGMSFDIKGIAEIITKHSTASSRQAASPPIEARCDLCKCQFDTFEDFHEHLYWHDSQGLVGNPR